MPIKPAPVLQPWVVTTPPAALSRTVLSSGQSAATLSPEGVTLLGAATNVLLACLKLGAGLCAGSASLIADAGHSLSDLISDAFCMLALKMRHERAEAACTLGIGALLFATGIGMGSAAGSALLALLRSGGGAAAPALGAATTAGVALRASEVAALLVAIFSVLSKETLFRVTRAVGTRHASPSLVANAFHHRSDALSSVAAIGGVGGSLLGFASVDLLAALTVGGMVLHMGVEVGSDALRQLLRRDRAAPEEPPPSPTATGSTLSSSSSPPASPSGSPSPKKGAEGFELRAARTSGDVARLDETGRLPQHLLFDQADQEPPSTTRQRR